MNLHDIYINIQNNQAQCPKTDFICGCWTYETDITTNIVNDNADALLPPP